MRVVSETDQCRGEIGAYQVGVDDLSIPIPLLVRVSSNVVQAHLLQDGRLEDEGTVSQIAEAPLESPRQPHLSRFTGTEKQKLDIAPVNATRSSAPPNKRGRHDVREEKEGIDRRPPLNPI